MGRRGLAAACATCVCLIHASMSFAADVVLYSTDAINLHGNWALAADASAAGGQLLASADNGWSAPSSALASPADYFEFTFSAPANTPTTSGSACARAPHRSGTTLCGRSSRTRSTRAARRSTRSDRPAALWSTVRSAAAAH
jgi:hypothetical protein